MRQDLEEQMLFRAFRTQILRTIEGYDGYRETIYSVTIEAKRVNDRTLDIFGIRRDNFKLVTYLAAHGKDLLDDLSSEPDLTEMQYQRLLDIFSKR